jgi:hypothetical protein
LEIKADGMKIINLNESQYKRLFEISSFVKSAGNEEGINGLPDNLTQDEEWTTAIINKDGEETHSEPPTTDKKQRMMAIQYPWSGGRGVPY